MSKRTGMIPKGEGWEVVSYLTDWIVWVNRPQDEICLVKITARGEREGTANITVAWDLRKQKFASVSRGTGMALSKMKNDMPGLYAEVEDALRAAAMDHVILSVPTTVKDYSPKKEGWSEVEAFKADGWKLWVKDGEGPWFTFKLVSTINRAKMVYWLAWSVEEQRFAYTHNSEALKTTDVYEALVKFLKEG